jgi:hypothetical protein
MTRAVAGLKVVVSNNLYNWGICWTSFSENGIEKPPTIPILTFYGTRTLLAAAAAAAACS